jgi:AraC-like DNA-binding protein
MKPTLEQVHASDQQSFRLFRRVAPTFDFRWHQHHELELTLILSGRGQHYAGDYVAPYAPGDLVLLGPDLPHTWRSEDAGPHEAVVVQFARDFCGEGFLELPESRPLRRLLDRSARGLLFRGRTMDTVRERLVGLLDLEAFACLTGLLEILLQVSARRGQVMSSPQAHTHVRAIDEMRIARACDYIQVHYARGVGLEAVAREAGMSGASFSRYFKHHTGRTFVAYLNDVRVGQACRLLIETDDPVTEICYAAGFGNLSNFNRRFKAVKEMTPRMYRAAYVDD